MINTSFLRNTCDIYKIDTVAKDCGFYEEQSIISQGQSCMVCCSEGKENISNCGNEISQDKEIKLKLPASYTIPNDVRRIQYIVKVYDLIGSIGEYRIDDIVPVVLPSGGLYCYNLIGYKVSQND